MNCRSLKELVIPAKVEVIYQEAFAGCSGLEAIKVLATTPPFAYDNTFSKYDIPLYVPEESVSAYQAANPWSKFTTFKTLTGGDITPKVCAKPTISYADGQIVFDCETEGVEYQSSITDSDIKSYTSETIQLSAAYTITVVATKSGLSELGAYHRHPAVDGSHTGGGHQPHTYSRAAGSSHPHPAQWRHAHHHGHRGRHARQRLRHIGPAARHGYGQRHHDHASPPVVLARHRQDRREKRKGGYK